MEYQACLEKISSNDISPDDFWKVIQNLFCIPSLDLFLYIVLGSLIIFIYKTSLDLYTRYKEDSKAEIETILNYYVDIHITTEKILYSLPINPHEAVEVYEKVKKSYTYIEYNVYNTFKELLLDSTLTDLEKIQGINNVLITKVPELIKKKNYFVNYDNGFKGLLSPFVISLRSLIIPAVITLGTLLGILLLIPLLLNQPNIFELYATLTALGLSIALLYDIESMIKSKIHLQRILYILMVLVSISLALTNNNAFIISLIIFIILFLTYCTIGIKYYIRQR